MSDTPPAGPTEATEEPTLRIHYIKSNLFRVIRADGALGAPTPHGEIHIAFFNERHPIPLQSIHHIGPNGALSEPIEMVSRDGIVREVEVDMLVSVPTARRIAEWLTQTADKIDLLLCEKEKANK